MAVSRSVVTPARRRRPREEAENEIHRVAARLFAGKGYLGTSIDDIARAAGIHKSTVFHHVSSKQDLLAAVLDRGLSRYVAAVRALAADDGLPDRDRLTAAVRNHLAFVFEHPVELTVFLRERKHLSGPRGEAYLRLSEEYEAVFTSIVADGMRSGALPPGDPRLFTLFLLGSANWIVEWYQPNGRLGRERITDDFIASFVPGPS